MRALSLVLYCKGACLVCAGTWRGADPGGAPVGLAEAGAAVDGVASRHAPPQRRRGLQTPVQVQHLQAMSHRRLQVDASPTLYIIMKF